MNTDVMFSSKTAEWATPDHVFQYLDDIFSFTLDPCATDQNAKCARYFTVNDNGLTQDWGQERVFMNPPYGREIAKWMAKAYRSAEKGALVVCLVPARTDTRWWHDYAMKASEIWFVQGRLKFGGSQNSAPFPSAIIIFDPSRMTDDVPVVRGIDFKCAMSQLAV